jgi:vacuolar-type H+-ATPase subunit I/STV1
MVDYSKWNEIDDDSDDEIKAPSSSLSSSSSSIPPQLSQKLFEMKDDPKALDNLDKELETLKQLAIKEKNETGNASNKTTKALSKQKNVLLNKLDIMEQQKKEMDDQMKELEQLASAGDPQSLLSFFEKQGMDRKDIQKMLGGSDHDSKEVLSNTVETVIQDKDVKLTNQAEAALELIDNLEDVLTDKTTPSSPSVEYDSNHDNSTKAKAKSIKNQINNIIPNYYQKIKNDNKDTTVIIVIELPLLLNASEAELDVSSRRFKLKAKPGSSLLSSEEEDKEALDDDEKKDKNIQYILSTELIQVVDPNKVVASWSKKKKTLTISIPIKQP